MAGRVLLAVLALACAGCAGRMGEPAPSARRPATIEWLGGQCYRVTSPLGTVLLTNPPSPRAAERPLPRPLNADVVLVTAERPDFNHIDAVTSQAAILRGSVGIGMNCITGIPITGIPIYKDAERPSVDGMSMIYTWTMDGMRFCYAGVPPGPLDESTLSRIGSTDVLIVHPGGLGQAALESLLARCGARMVVVPRQAPGLPGPVTPVARLSLHRESLPSSPELVAFGQ